MSTSRQILGSGVQITHPKLQLVSVYFLVLKQYQFNIVQKDPNLTGQRSANDRKLTVNDESAQPFDENELEISKQAKKLTDLFGWEIKYDSTEN